MAKVTSRVCIGLKTIVLVWVRICVACKDNVAEGRSVSKKNYLEAKVLVKFLNQPKVKSIQVENGDIFDCVMINKQLALEHPSLQNHTIQNDDYNAFGCYNLYCPGFVQVSSKLPLALAITPVSIYGGSQSEMFVSVSKDPKTGNWLLSVNGEFVGYWPKTVYNALSTGGANRADWGGEHYGLGSVKTKLQSLEVVFLAGESSEVVGNMGQRENLSPSIVMAVPMESAEAVSLVPVTARFRPSSGGYSEACSGSKLTAGELGLNQAL
ncbi:hypothetical protein NE237_012134 [Protea cynaroides]|uniref:Neprosin PEP catalytic domain-containing protein n=1 Tax=Protea cynaroides TaxID=273540 RepID=A0A9Q0JXD1_9MAGN|nr:hypothetical protein NE237_012134 [Protea cynaroides]